MHQAIKDPRQHFHSAFDPETGVYIRTKILDEHGQSSFEHRTARFALGPGFPFGTEMTKS